MAGGEITNDLIDVLMRHLAPPQAAPRAAAQPPVALALAKPAPKWAPLPPPRGRHFLTDHEIRRALTPGAQHLTIPRDAIVSPLAEDWLSLKGVRIVRETP